MAGPLVGRAVVIYKSADSPVNAIAALTAKSIKIGATPVDVTTDDDLGFRKLLANVAGQKQIDMTLEGVAKNSAFLSLITNGNLTDTYVLDIEGIGEITCTFNVVDLSFNAPYNEATTFSVELQSSGAWTFAAD